MFLKHLKKISHNSSFRLIVLYSTLYISSSLVLLGFIFWSTNSYIFKQMDHHIEYDRLTLMQIYTQYGEDKLIESIEERLKREVFDSIYLLYHSKNGILSGNLGMIPEEVTSYGWHRIDLHKCLCEVSEHSQEAQVLVKPLDKDDEGELIFLNGLDMNAAYQQKALIINSMSAGIFIILLLGTVGGIIITRNTLRKIDLINHTIMNIREGELEHRIPLRGTDDDYDLLALNINQMLEQINVLIENIQNISNHISHDLRTPLTRMRAKLENIMLTASPDQMDCISGAIEEADSLLSAFNAILRISKVESGANTGSFEDFSMTKLLQDVGEFYEPLADDKEIALSLQPINIAKDNIPFHGDRDMLFQAIANVVDNAIKYSSEGGHIHLSLEQDASQIILRIADNGQGIPEEAREKVFDRFYQLSKHRGNRGHGLGLSLVQAIIKLHQGEINLKDNQPGLIVELVFHK